MKEFRKYVGLAAYKNTIAVVLAEVSGDKPRFNGEIPKTNRAVSKLVMKVRPNGEVPFCYEAGPCGYGIYRQLTGFPN